jgi:hypothetical protein
MHASRRDFLRSSGMGFGSIALAGLLARDGVTGALPTHFPARAKRVIHVFLNGGMSQVDSLYRDVPPLLQRSVFASLGADPLAVDLRRSVHGDSSGVRGAAWLWRTNGLSPSSA